jgi:hypothetical protein
MRQNTRAPCDLFNLFCGIHREQRNTQRMGAGNVALLLDGVAEGDALGRGASGERHFDLRHRGGVEA